MKNRPLDGLDGTMFEINGLKQRKKTNATQAEGGCVWSTNHERRINGPDGRFPKSKAEKTKKKKPASVNLGGGGDKVW